MVGNISVACYCYSVQEDLIFYEKMTGFTVEKGKEKRSEVNTVFSDNTTQSDPGAAEQSMLGDHNTQYTHTYHRLQDNYDPQAVQIQDKKTPPGSHKLVLPL